MQDPMKSESWLILELGFAILVVTLLSFWRNPVYGAGAALGFSLLGDAFKVLIGYKIGRSMPQQANDPKAGATTVTDTHVASSVPPDAVVAPKK